MRGKSSRKLTGRTRYQTHVIVVSNRQNYRDEDVMITWFRYLSMILGAEKERGRERER